MSSGWFGPWRREPDPGFERMRREMDELLQRFGGQRQAAGRGVPFPAVNLYEADDGFVLTAELPGVRGEDLGISIEGTRVTLRGERKIEYDEKANLHRCERQSGVFRRAFELPAPGDPDKAEARYRNGVLMLRIPKARSHRPRQIDVQAG
jgi:HSP20 family protein